MEFSTNKITPNDNVKIPSMNGNNSGYQLDSELREYVQAGVSGVTEQYSNLSTYAYGKRLKHEGVEYRCIVPVETPENFDPDKWVKVDLTELDKRILENASAINAISTQVSSLLFPKTAYKKATVISCPAGNNVLEIRGFSVPTGYEIAGVISWNVNDRDSRFNVTGVEISQNKDGVDIYGSLNTSWNLQPYATVLLLPIGS